VNRPIRPMDGRDLECIVALLEMAAIELTPVPEATFTRDELVAKAREIGGPEVTLADADVDNVIAHSGHLLRKAWGGRYALR